jgi:hypothetical protein
MRLSTIVACLLLVSPSSALACYEHGAEATQKLSSPHRAVAAEGAEAEEASMLGVRLAGAGLASLALVVVAFRALSRAPGRGRARPVELEPATPAESSAPFDRPGDPRIRIDQGHERPEPTRSGRDEEALSYALAMH